MENSGTIDPPTFEDLGADAVFNAANPLVMRQVAGMAGGGLLDDRMRDWYVFVRDAIRYDPFAISLEQDDLAASRTLENKQGHCVHKSILLVAGFRAMGVPARLGLAKVRNHLATESLERKLGTDVLTPHGYAAFWNGERWMKCTPVFNRSLCERLGTSVLEWDPSRDVLFQPLDGAGGRFMEYLDDFGLHSTVPLDFMRAQLEGMYPHAFDAQGRWCLGA